MKAFFNEPPVSLPIRGFHVSHLYLIALPDDIDDGTLRALLNRPLRNEDRIGLRDAVKANGHKLTRQQDPIGIWKDHARLPRTGLGPQSDIRKVQNAVMLVGRAVHEDDGTRQMIDPRMLDSF